MSREYKNTSDIWMLLTDVEILLLRNAILVLVNDHPQLEKGQTPTPSFPIEGPYPLSPAFPNQSTLPFYYCEIMNNYENNQNTLKILVKVALV